jgi:ribosomal subunit interface protein
MDVVVRTRNAKVGGRFQERVQAKIEHLTKLDARAERLEVEVCEERNRRQQTGRIRVELTCRTRGAALRAAAAAADAFAALELAADKLEQQLRRAADRRRVHHGARTPQSVADATAAVAGLDRAIIMSS